MTSDISEFDGFEEYDGGNIKFRNDGPCLVKGRALLILNEKITCDDAYWV